MIKDELEKGADGGWQPIETAPKNWPRILVWSIEMGPCVASREWRNESPDVIEWGVVNDITVTPTHWFNTGMLINPNIAGLEP